MIEFIDASGEVVSRRYNAAMHEALKWAMDILDMYDERLAEYDGEDLVYNSVHVDMKSNVRALLANAESLDLDKCPCGECYICLRPLIEEICGDEEE